MQKKGLIKRIFGKVRKNKVAKALPVAGAVGLAAGSAFAGQDTTFNTITTTINDWLTGSLGKALSIATLAVGGGYAVATQSAKAAVSATGIALILAYGPDALDSIFTALF